ncbi:MAG: ATP-binding cassette domain-containing protein [Pseudomonadota bacterium]
MLEARGISLSLGGLRVLDDVSLSLEPGEVLALVGPNGAGKSTLLACLSGALIPDVGHVDMDGEEPRHLTPAALGQRRAVLDQSPAVAAPFTLAELVELGIPRAIAPGDARRLVSSCSHALGLSALIDRRIDALSGGERHRAHMARTLAQLRAGRMLGAGRWLLLDEPTASLDLKHQAAAMQAARTAAREGAGVLAILHDLSLAAATADRVAVMRAGRIIATGPPAETLTPEILSPVYGIGIAVTDLGAGLRAIVPHYASPEGEHRCSSP